jgi:hypothetical protein
MVRTAGHFTETRKFTKQRLLDFIKNNRSMPIEKILAIFSLQTGLKTSTLQVYVMELKEAGVLD